jgi:spore germination protein
MITKYRVKNFFRKYFLAQIFGLVIIGLVTYSILLHRDKMELELKLQGIYEKSFQELMLDMKSLETKLSKLEASADQYQNTMILMDVWRQTGDTESSIAQLPVSYTKASPFIQFVNRTGDYCRYLSKKVGEGQSINADDLKQIADLRQSCTEISTILDKAWKSGYLPDISNKDVDFVSGGGEETSGNLDFSNQNYPRLIYDGPYSESTENKQPQGLEGENINEEAAKKKVIEFVGEEQIGEIKKTEGEGGDIPSFGFDGKLKDGNSFSIFITKQGGQILWYMQQTNGKGAAVPTDEKYEKLTDMVIEFVKKKGITNAVASYAQFYAGNAVINIVPLEGEVALYPDLIKVWIDIEQNKIVGMDAKNFIMSHKKRKLEEPKLSKEQAATHVTTSLKIEDIRLALIPTESQKETLCWEFIGKIETRDYIIYINSESGKTEDIFLIQHTNEGTLVQ